MSAISLPVLLSVAALCLLNDPPPHLLLCLCGYQALSWGGGGAGGRELIWCCGNFLWASSVGQKVSLLKHDGLTGDEETPQPGE